MLVLTRKVGEQITLPCCDVTMEVVDVRGKRVRIGVDAPPGVAVYRAELQRRRDGATDPQRQSAAEEPRGSVLLAESQRRLRIDYERSLRSAGFAVEIAPDAMECLARLRQSPPDVLVLDSHLPWGGGDGVLALMREEPSVPLVPTLLRTHDLALCDGVLPVVRCGQRPLNAGRLIKYIEDCLDRSGRRSLGPLVPVPDDLSDRLETAIERCAHGRIHCLHVEAGADGILVRGQASSFYGFQLAQAAVNGVLQSFNEALRPAVVFDIRYPGGAALGAARLADPLGRKRCV